MAEQCSNGSVEDLTCDAIPDPPRIPNTFNENQTSEKLSNTPISENNSTSTNTESKTSNVKYSKPKKKTARSSSTTINNFNIVSCENINIGPTTSYVYNKYEDHKCNSNSVNEEKEEIKQMLPYVQALSSSKTKVTKDDIFVIKTHIGENWKKFAKKIGYSKGQIDQFFHNHGQKGIGEVVYQILLDWIQAFTSDATIGRAVCALSVAGEYDCIEKLAYAHKLL